MFNGCKNQFHLVPEGPESGRKVAKCLNILLFPSRTQMIPGKKKIIKSVFWGILICGTVEDQPQCPGL
jgi:hypothetical protein